ncbi:hypothetical protein TrRE_jg5299, partial [Triparma retinervis]
MKRVTSLSKTTTGLDHLYLLPGSTGSNIDSTAEIASMSLSTKLKVNFGNPETDEDSTPLEKLHNSATPLVYEAILLHKLATDTANSKCASLSLTLPTGGVIIGNVMDLVAAQLAFGAGPLDQHVMAEIVLKSLEAVIDLHKDYHIIHNSLSPPNLVISKSEDSELAVSIVGFGAQSIDLQENNCDHPDVLFTCFEPLLQEQVITGPLLRCPHSCPAVLPRTSRCEGDTENSWKFQPDNFGVADIAHFMLFGGRPLEVVRDSNGKYCPKAFISGYTPYRRTWEAVFDVLLNPRKGSDGGSEQFGDVIELLENIVEEGSLAGRIRVLDTLGGFASREGGLVSSADTSFFENNSYICG